MHKRMLMIGLVLAQLAVPAGMIASQEQVLRKGAVYKFKIAPVDPYDIFRGRYVALSMEQGSVPVPDAENFRTGQAVYVILSEDGPGLASVIDVKAERPSHPRYFKTRVNNVQGRLVYFDSPFDRYYMNEYKAPLAERISRVGSGRQGEEQRTAYVRVRVLNGTALIEGLYVDDKPIESYF